MRLKKCRFTEKNHYNPSKKNNIIEEIDGSKNIANCNEHYHNQQYFPCKAIFMICINLCIDSMFLSETELMIWSSEILLFLIIMKLFKRKEFMVST